MCGSWTAPCSSCARTACFCGLIGELAGEKGAPLDHVQQEPGVACWPLPAESGSARKFEAQRSGSTRGARAVCRSLHDFEQALEVS